MANEIRQNTLIIPAGTPISAPVSMDVSFPPRDVSGLQIFVPPGGNGALGFQIQNSGLPVIPYDSDEWIIANNEVITWPMTDYVNSGSWQVAGYNLGTNDHAIYFRWLLDYLTAPDAVGAAVLIPAATLSSAPTATSVALVASDLDDGTGVDLSTSGV